MKKIILASQSPRRKELMNLADFDFDIIPSNCEEIITEKEPCKVVEQLSKQKALDVYNKIKNTEEYSNNILVIGLGNDKSTPDSLGPKVIDNLIITRHLFVLGEDISEGIKDMKRGRNKYIDNYRYF